MTVSAGDVVRAAASWNVSDSSIAQNVFHFLYAGSGDTNAEVVAKIRTFVLTAWAGFVDEMNDQVSATDLDCWRWDGPVTKFTGIGIGDLSSIVGTDTNTLIPHISAGLIRFITDPPRRQGRKYICGMAANENVDGKVTTTGAVALVTLGQLLDNVITTANGTLTPGVFDTTLELFTGFTGTVQSSFDWSPQKRRKPGVGLT